MHDIEMVVLIKDRPIYEYEHNNQYFVEGRAGSNYELQLTNHTSGRVEVILSVDGLSVIDGKEAGPHSRSYLIDCKSSLKVPGWLLDSGSAAKFAFAGKGNSYASQIDRGQNIGVIGALVYKEKSISYPLLSPYLWNSNIPVTNVFTPTYPNYPINYPFNYSAYSINNIASSRGTSSSAVNSATVSSAPASSMYNQSLGTAFGDQTSFVTHPVAFNRGEQLVVMSLYYDNLRGLRAKGVPIEQRQKVSHKPNAFPGLTGCVPPPNWQANTKN
jgi:hypothetical protein